MSDISDRYRKVAATFTQRVSEVPPDAWDDPAPCEGWVARDVVGHLVEWLPAFFVGVFGIDMAPVPSLDDPAAAWAVVDAAFQAALDDPSVASVQRDTPMGPKTFEDAVDMICTNDVLIHTWDLARATGLDERLDPDEVHAYVSSMEPLDDLLRSSGQYGPRVPVADDADEQTRLIAFLGRQP